MAAKAKVESDATKKFNNFKPIAISLLKKAPWNYKTNDDNLQAKLVANIKRSGQIENVLVRPLGDGTYEIVNGNHRLDAFQTLEFDKVFAYDLGPISEAHAKRIAIETNETKFDSDPIQLATIVNEISGHFPDFIETAPFSTEQLDNFSSLLTFDWAAADLADEDIEDDESVEKGKKTETILSVGGEDFKVIKLELSSACADRLSLQIQRLRSLSNESADDPINIICGVLETMSDDQLKLDHRPARKKVAKKVSLKK